jgi:hypothetical protein
VNNRGLTRLTCFKGALNVGRFIIFPSRLIKGPSGEIFLVVDNLWVQHAVTVSKWVAAHKDKIELFFVSRYELKHNPDEYAGNGLKR